MTDPQTPGYRTGDVVNDHVLTGAGWIPFRRLPYGASGPYLPGDVVGDHVFTGTAWVSAAQSNELTPAVFVPHAPMQPLGQSKAGRWIGCFTLVVFALVCFGILVGTIASVREDTPRTDVPVAPAPSPNSTSPTPGYDLLYANRMHARGWFDLGPGLLGKWNGITSDGLSAVVKLRVISRGGCPNGAYVEGNVEDGSGTIVGFVNAGLPRLPPKRDAILELRTSKTGVKITDTTGTCS